MKIDVKIDPDRLKLLETAEKRNRRETKQAGLRAEPVSVLGLLLLQNYECPCGQCERLPLDLASKWDDQNIPPGYAVIAHELLRRAGGEHTIKNVRIWRHECNAKMATQIENKQAGVGRRMTVYKPDIKTPEQRVSPKKKGKWASRKLQSRNTFKKK